MEFCALVARLCCRVVLHVILLLIVLNAYKDTI